MSTQELKKKAADLLEKNLMWGIAFIGVCVLVGMGKLKPETIEYFLFAILGRSFKGEQK